MSTLAPIQGNTASQSRITQLRFWLLLGGLTALLFVSITLGVTLGPVDIPVGAVARVTQGEASTTDRPSNGVVAEALA